jgi:hypothetical protein
LWSFFQTRNGKRKKKEKKGENGKENSNWSMIETMYIIKTKNAKLAV